VNFTAEADMVASGCQGQLRGAAALPVLERRQADALVLPLILARVSVSVSSESTKQSSDRCD
jgi:hypothetical protein